MIPLEQLSVYLPYKLMCLTPKHQFKYGTQESILMTGLSVDLGELIVEFLRNDDLELSNTIKWFKPLLHPLSQLTEEIEIDGERFVPIKRLNELNIDPNCDPVVLNDGTINYDPLKEYQLLFKWHFDIFGLIDKGLAEPIK